MIRILIVSPHFPPVNAADMHRVRCLLPYLSNSNIEAEVLTVEPEQTTFAVDPWLEQGLPEGIRIHRVKAMSLKWGRIPGFGSLGFRSMRALARRGDHVLSGRHFDLIYFSTTVFEVHCLGPRWRRKFGLPFIIDYQDPWVNDYYLEHPDVTPPGGRVKYGIVSFLHRRMEPWVLKSCSGITSVSSAYPTQIFKRYPRFSNMPFIVKPFPVDPNDFGDERILPEQKQFNSEDGKIHWMYLGVVIPAMELALRSLFRALVREENKDLLANLELHFIGTNYARGEKAKPVVLPIADEYGLTGYVNEQEERIPYCEVISCLRTSDALMVLGSNDSGYSASKISPCLLARKPLLVIFHEDSPVSRMLDEVGGAHRISFGDHVEATDLANDVHEKWIVSKNYQKVLPLVESSFLSHTASASAVDLCNFFASVVDEN
jgi:hypothetical protein